MSTKAVRPPKRPTASLSFEKEMAELDALKGIQLDPAQIQFVRKFLAHRNNFLVSKAARRVAEAELADLLPDVLAAYDRFFVDPVKTDPQCWAKTALAKALVKLEHRGKDAFLRGMRHHQLEPVWGGSSDTAGALRGACTHALVDCPGISDSDLLTALLDPLVDEDKTVRVEAARAIAQVGGVSAPLILRLRVLLGKDEPEPEVMGACYAALLSLEGAEAVPLVAKSLDAGDDLAAEAAYALADLRTPEALAALTARLRAGADPWFTAVLLSSIALTRLPDAVDLLIGLVANDAREAPAAIEALGRAAPSQQLRARIQAAIEQADSPRLRQAFREHLPPSE